MKTGLYVTGLFAFVSSLLCMEDGSDVLPLVLYEHDTVAVEVRESQRSINNFGRLHSFLTAVKGTHINKLHLPHITPTSWKLAKEVFLQDDYAPQDDISFLVSRRQQMLRKIRNRSLQELIIISHVLQSLDPWMPQEQRTHVEKLLRHDAARYVRKNCDRALSELKANTYPISDSLREKIILELALKKLPQEILWDSKSINHPFGFIEDISSASLDDACLVWWRDRFGLVAQEDIQEHAHKMSNYAEVKHRDTFSFYCALNSDPLIELNGLLESINTVEKGLGNLLHAHCFKEVIILSCEGSTIFIYPDGRMRRYELREVSNGNINFFSPSGAFFIDKEMYICSWLLPDKQDRINIFNFNENGEWNVTVHCFDVGSCISSSWFSKGKVACLLFEKGIALIKTETQETKLFPMEVFGIGGREDFFLSPDHSTIAHQCQNGIALMNSEGLIKVMSFEDFGLKDYQFMKWSPDSNSIAIQFDDGVAIIGADGATHGVYRSREQFDSPFSFEWLNHDSLVLFAKKQAALMRIDGTVMTFINPATYGCKTFLYARLSDRSFFLVCEDGGIILVDSYGRIAPFNTTHDDLGKVHIIGGQPAASWSSDGCFLSLNCKKGIMIIDCDNLKIHTIMKNKDSSFGVLYELVWANESNHYAIGCQKGIVLMNSDDIIQTSSLNKATNKRMWCADGSFVSALKESFEIFFPVISQKLEKMSVNEVIELINQSKKTTQQ